MRTFWKRLASVAMHVAGIPLWMVEARPADPRDRPTPEEVLRQSGPACLGWLIVFALLMAFGLLVFPPP